MGRTRSVPGDPHLAADLIVYLNWLSDGAGGPQGIFDQAKALTARLNASGLDIKTLHEIKAALRNEDSPAPWIQRSFMALGGFQQVQTTARNVKVLLEQIRLQAEPIKVGAHAASAHAIDRNADEAIRLIDADG